MDSKTSRTVMKPPAPDEGETMIGHWIWGHVMRRLDRGGWVAGSANSSGVISLVSAEGGRVRS